MPGNLISLTLSLNRMVLPNTGSSFSTRLNMKRICIIIALLVSLQAGAQLQKARLQAGGLTCAMCSKAVYKALTAVPFVEKVTPDIEGSSYAIQFRKDAAVQLDDLSKAVTDAGFSVSSLQVTANFRGAKMQDNAHVALGGQVFHFLGAPVPALSGERTLQVIDRNFVSEKQAKKYSKLTDMACYSSGTMDGKRIYHVTL
jgi:copper chaperone CopZ